MNERIANTQLRGPRRLVPPNDCSCWVHRYDLMDGEKRRTCPDCGVVWKRTAPVPARPWRNWDAPEGHWVPSIILTAKEMAS